MTGASVLQHLVCKLAPLLLCAAAQAESLLTLSPSQCITDSDSCELQIAVRWQTDEPGNVCLMIMAETTELLCQLPASQSELQLKVTSQQAVQFALLSSDHSQLLASQQLAILHIPKRKPRRKAAWSIF